ncbi:Arginine repressor [Meiothermus luteus]|jgi:transcriptional regulator of arginine metabolism|uniref:Arginine repressor n=1 Tax=Meiothermus luteus TaxID=2026184 RepID=A0A399EHS6_9DEIN|nr:arginine repressor [Meiothermus luteus]RIH84197.1 Arginine repressor [Meiothermus luteus]RMH55736.1 MAG: arginine repressor [Deinococcota bacterium]
MASKEQRQRAIQEIISRETISTQAELVERLRQMNFKVTQATVSRDINEMRLVRLPLGGGKHKYVLAGMEMAEHAKEELRRIFPTFVHDVDRGENILVLKVSEGHASGIALLIDRLRRDDIVGTLAGEDAILVVARSKEQAQALQEEFESLMALG